MIVYNIQELQSPAIGDGIELKVNRPELDWVFRSEDDNCLKTESIGKANKKPGSIGKLLTKPEIKHTAN